MIVMALDHVRNYFTAANAEPEMLDDPGLALFLTRWITHYCAPIFVFLSGTSAWLSRRQTGASDSETRRFLITRGAWLVCAEFLVINPLWPLWIDGFLFAQVIWAIGWSMIVLGLVMPLGRRAILALGLVLVFGHNLLDGISAESLGAVAPLWMFLHQSGVIALSESWNFYLVYPIVPWIGVMMLGYVAGGLLTENSDWQRVSMRVGLAAVALFLALRVTNLYGNPTPFVAAETASQTLINFLNVQKYPPSLQYLLMTLGPAFMLLPLLERWRGWFADVVSVYGRVPFFYYVLHFALIYALAITWSYVEYGRAFWWFRGEAAFPEGYTLELWRTYAVWAIVVISLYVPCRWYADFKRRNRGLWWLSYA